jgi:hypothetical protein
MSINKTGSDKRSICVMEECVRIKMALLKAFLGKNIQNKTVFYKNRASLHFRKPRQHHPVMNTN